MMEIREGKYLLKLAETPEEKNQSFVLRHQVYCGEMKFAEKHSDSKEATAKECDAFDELCDHLIIRDEEKDLCIGTFRFLPGGRLPEGGNFYSEQWFDIGTLGGNRKGVLELGRACIDPEYRNTVVFRLLFGGLGAYLKLYPHDYLIGLTTLSASAKNDIGAIAKYLIGNNAINHSFGVKPKCRLELSPADREFALEDINQRALIKKMSTLMLAYYKYGAQFISEPSVDVDFNPPVYDFFTIFDTKKFPTWVEPGRKAVS